MRKLLCVLALTTITLTFGSAVADVEPTNCLAPVASGGVRLDGPHSSEVCTAELSAGDRAIQVYWAPGSTGYVTLRVGTESAPVLLVDCSVIAGVTFWCHSSGNVTRATYITLNVAPYTTGIRFEFPLTEPATASMRVGEQGTGGTTPWVVAAVGVFNFQTF